MGAKGSKLGFVRYEEYASSAQPLFHGPLGLSIAFSFGMVKIVAACVHPPTRHSL